MSGLFEFLITSSILILVITVLRILFSGKTSMRLQYALWLLVAVKLLVFPVPQLESPLSVQKLLEPLESRMQQSLYGAGVEKENDNTGSAQTKTGDARQENGMASAQAGTAGEQKTALGFYLKSAKNAGESRQRKKDVSTGYASGQEIAKIEWITSGTAAAGSAVLFLYFVSGNIRLAVYLHKRRIRWNKNGFPLPVYLVEGLPSPFLYEKAVYITPELLADEQRLSHILIHEYCHYRQGDLLWSLLRGLCLTGFWWHPLVWLAAYLSKQDCELACDEAAMACLGTEERLSYGKTLLSLVPVQAGTKDSFFITSAMTGGRRSMKRRIQKIAQNQKSALSVCFLAAFLAVMCFASVSTVKPASGPADVLAEKDGTGENGSEEKAGSPNDTLAEKEREQEKTLELKEKNSGPEDKSAENTAQNNEKTGKDRSDTAKIVMNLDEAVGQAVLSDNEARFGLEDECVAEGHIRLEEKQGKNGQVTVYALTMYGEYMFHDGFFVKDAGTGVIPTVMKFSYDKDTGYVLKKYQIPMDGAYYPDSIHEMFPEHLWETCLSISEEVIEELTEQERAYAKQYLKKIGRKASVGDYADTEHPLLTDAGVSVEVSNSLYAEAKSGELWKYPDWIGNLERVEDGVRYVYELALDQKAGEIVYTKSVYDTGEIVERYRIDMYTGKEL